MHLRHPGCGSKTDGDKAKTDSIFVGSPPGSAKSNSLFYLQASRSEDINCCLIHSNVIIGNENVMNIPHCDSLETSYINSVCLEVITIIEGH